MEGASTLISGISDFRFEYFGKNGFPTTDSALVARVRVTDGPERRPWADDP